MAAGDGVAVRNRPREVAAEDLLGPEGPVGLAEEGTGQKDQVGAALPDDLVGLVGLGDEADGRRPDVGFLTDAGGEWYLVALGDGDLDGGQDAAGGSVDEVNPFGLEGTGENDRLLDVPAAFGPVGGGDADEEGHVCGQDLADAAGHL